MVEELRRDFNERFTEHRFSMFRQRLDDRFGRPITFRVCETPLFVSEQMRRTCETAGDGHPRDLHGNAAYHEASAGALRPDLVVRHRPDHPAFVCVDFALVNEDGAVVPRLVELQGFPSVMAYQLIVAEMYVEHFRLSTDLIGINGDLSRSELLAAMRRTIVGDHEIEDVVLMDLDPWNQKTCPDFRATNDLLGVPVVDARSLKKEGRRLFYETSDGTLRPIRRIFNRAIADEIDRREEELPFRWTDELDLEWAGHPNWFYQLSKFSMPFLDHPSVPATHFLSDFDSWPDDLDEYVLKPLYSFAGTGVVVGPDQTILDAIPSENRRDFILQRRVRYAEVIDTPAGRSQAELRIMLLWEPDGDPTPAMSLVRTGRGAKMGVDANTRERWIGASCALFTG